MDKLSCNSMSNWTDGNIPITHPIAYDSGKNHHYAWISYMSVLVPGVILNVIALYFMFFNEKVKKNKNTVFLKYLAIQDFFASVVCLIQCAVNLRFMMIFGEKIACFIEAWQIVFFIGISGFSVCLFGIYIREIVSIGNKKSVCDCTSVRNLDNVGILKIHLVAWLIYAVLAVFATVFPGRSRPLSSGTYCMPAYEEPMAALFFFGLIIFPCAIFLIWNYLVFYIYLRKNERAKQEMELDTTNIKRKNITPFFAFVIVYCVFYSPFFFAACYEWITGLHSHVYFDFIAGLLTHGVSVFNPIMYVLWTKHCRKEIIRIFRWIFGLKKGKTPSTQ